MPARHALAILSLSLLLSPGCDVAATQGYMAAEGIQSRTFELKRASGQFPFDRFQRVEVEKFDSKIEGKIPEEITDQVQRRVVNNALESRLFPHADASGEGPTDKPTLLVRGTYIDFHPGASLGRTIAFGGDGLLTARVSLVDKATGEVLWVGHVTGFLRAAVSGKIRELGEGIGEGVQEVLTQYHSPAPKS